MIMKLSSVFCGFLVLALLACAWQDAEAARIGGKRSFGSKPSMSTPYTKPAPSSSSTLSRQSTQQQAGQAAARPGLFGGMGGMLGGLLAGSLLGSLLFGGGFQGGGFLDLLLVGALLFLVFRFLSRRRAAASGGYGNAAPDFNNPGRNDLHYQSAPQQAPRSGGLDWGALSGSGASPASAPAQETFSRVPAGFDEQDFLEGAKAAYLRLNESWDKRDLDDIARFATPTCMNVLRAQAQADPGPSRTEILMVNAALAGVETDGDKQFASVFFSVLLRETPDQSAPADVREVWHFVRPASGEGNWKLDGIQQVEQ